MIDKELKEKIVSDLDGNGIDCERCLACKKKTLNLEDECIRNICVSDINKVCAAILFTCGNCGYIMQFSLKALGLEVNTELFR
jgi:hypothetical protein